jgi:putative ABC transport system substrate-binding protein
VIGRRALLRALGFGALIDPRFGLAQPAPAPGARVFRVGVLYSGTAASNRVNDAAFVRAMAELGYAEGRNLALDFRYADGRLERMADIAGDLVRSAPDVILAGSHPAIAAAQRATRTIPIVMAVVGDPVGAGFVASLAHPGGNITGMTNIAPELSAKRLALLRDLVPGLRRIGVLGNPAIPTYAAMLGETESAAAALGLTAVAVGLGAEDQVEAAFATLARAEVQAVVLLSDAVTAQLAPVIVRHVAARRLPAMYPLPQFMAAGGLMMYGPRIADLYRRSASFVDRILRGAEPGDLPVEQPTGFELTLNLKTARALGIDIPPAFLQRVDDVIE